MLLFTVKTDSAEPSSKPNVIRMKYSNYYNL